MKNVFIYNNKEYPVDQIVKLIKPTPAYNAGDQFYPKGGSGLKTLTLIKTGEDRFQMLYNKENMFPFVLRDFDEVFTEDDLENGLSINKKYTQMFNTK